MQPTLRLSVFGPPCLQTDTGETLITAPLPVLIATYVAIEHQGEAKNREEICRLFYPIDFKVPSCFSPITQELYQHFWITLTQAQNSTTSLFVNRETLITKVGNSLSKEALQNAHQQLLDYAIIEKVVSEKEGWRYYPNKQLVKYLKREENRIEATNKTFSEHIGSIRASVKKVAEEKAWQNIVPTGKTGQKACTASLIICIPTSIEQLKEALENNDLDIIKKIYQGPFLANIEKKIQDDGKWFFSPELRAWIFEKRDEFNTLISNKLIELADKSDSINTFKIIQKHTQESAIYSAILDKKLNETLKIYSSTVQNNKNQSEPISFTSLPPIANNSNENILPAFLRTHLLNKTHEYCELKLKTTNNKWMKTCLTIYRKDRWSEKSLDIQNTKLIKLIFEKSYGFAVLLGDAGMGKSIGLCYLAESLIKEAEHSLSKPIPLLFHLADWGQKPCSFEEWLKYQLVRLGLAEKYIDEEFDHLVKYQQCILLLDGFDNLPPIQRSFYLQSINHFIVKYGEAHLGGIILTSRTEEYLIAKEQYFIISKQDTFYFQTEATLLPLSQDYTHQYLETHTSIPTDVSKQFLEADGLKEFLNIPLGLTLFIHNTQNHFLELEPKSSNDNPTNIKSTLIENYVKQRLEHASQQAEITSNEFPLYSNQQVYTWLGYIARYLYMGNTFYLENITPEILNPSQQKKYQILFSIFFSVIFGLMMGSVAGLIFGERVAPKVTCVAFTTDHLNIIHAIFNFWVENNTVINKLNLILIYTCIGILIALLINRISLLLFKSIYFPFYLGGYLAFFMGFTGWLVDGSQWSILSITFYGTLGIILGMVIDPIHTNSDIISLSKDIHFRKKHIIKKLYNSPHSLVFIPLSLIFTIGLSFIINCFSIYWALLNGLTIGLSFTLGHVIYRSKYNDDWHKKILYSQQKLNVTIKRSVTMIFLVGGSITILITILSFPLLTWPGNLSFALRLGMPLGIAFGFISYGGIEVLKHYILRLVMYQEGIAPANYTTFLEYAKNLGFLRTQSGGYVFHHDWFQEYFANR